MKAHRTDGVSLTFALIFLGLAAWWLVAQLMQLTLPAIGWLVAAALIGIGTLGLFGALRADRSGRQPATAPGTPDSPATPADTTPTDTMPADTAAGDARPADASLGTLFDRDTEPTFDRNAEVFSDRDTEPTFDRDTEAFSDRETEPSLDRDTEAIFDRDTGSLAERDTEALPKTEALPGSGVPGPEDGDPARRSDERGA